MKFSKRKYRERYLRWHKSYEKRAKTEVNKAFKSWLGKIEWDAMTEGNYGLLLDEAITEDEMSEAYFNIYYNIGLKHAKRVGKEINARLKDFTLVAFLTLFELNIRTFFIQQGLFRITTVRNTFFEGIEDLIKAGLDEGKSMRIVASEIEPLVNNSDFTRWMAERIARTEATAASNYATIQAGNVAGYKMNKEWISAQDARTRRKPKAHYDHYTQNGIVVGIHEPFIMRGKGLEQDSLLYPGDPNGQAGNVINCRCTVAVIPERTKDGDLIPI